MFERVAAASDAHSPTAASDPSSSSSPLPQSAMGESLDDAPSTTTCFGHRSSFISHVITEFVQTEEAYRSTLQVLLNAYAKPLMNAPNGEQLKGGFVADLYRIIACHEIIKNELTKLERLHNAESTAFAAVLLAMAPSLKQAYTDYVVGYDSHSVAIKDARAQLANESVMSAIAEGMKAEDPALSSTDVTFDSLRAMPMQRLVRYSLLCSEFVKKSEAPENSEELLTAKAAAHAIQELCDAVNESRQRIMSMRELMQIEHDFKMYGLSANPQRRLLSNGVFVRATATRSDASGGFKLRHCRVFLFSDKLVLSKLGGDMRSVQSNMDVPLRCIRAVATLRSDGPHSRTGFACGLVVKCTDAYRPDAAYEFLLLDPEGDRISVEDWKRKIAVAVSSVTSP